ncbi:MAG: dockerin type I repeat-containing protein [Clostridia bacterium]|nr:dockerin type I repeat-containing protein [Clostridia bacterium]
MKFYKKAMSVFLVIGMLFSLLPCFASALVVVDDNAHISVEVNYDADYGEYAFDVYLNNCIGLTSYELFFNLPTEYAVAYSYNENGADAGELAKTKNNAYTAECNLLDSKTLKYGAYFKECLWIADSFTGDAKRGQTVTVNTEKFHAATVYVTCDDQALLKNITATADLEFKGNTFDGMTYETIGFVSGVAVPMTFNLSCPHKNTEIRNQKDATHSEEGYTGDTYCLDCGKKIATGSVIPKLTGEFISISDNAHISAQVSYDADYGEYVFDVYLNDCIGLTSYELFFNLPAEYAVEYSYNENGTDAEELAKTKTNAYTSECNLLDSRTLKYSAYFKECLWTADSFTADAKRGQTVTVNTEKFHAATIYVTCDDQTLIEGITATADIEFKGNTFNNKTYETLGFVYGATVPMTFNLSCPHKNTEIRNQKDATHSEEGYTGDTFCTDCGEKIASGTVIPVLPLPENGYVNVVISPDREYDNYYKLDVYLNDCVGMTSFETYIIVPSFADVRFDYWEYGADAAETGDSKANSFTAECAAEVNNEIKLSAFFKEALWTAEEFAADAKRNEDCVVNAEHFHAATIYVECDDAELLQNLSGTSDIEYKGYNGLNGHFFNIPSLFEYKLTCDHYNTEIRGAKFPTYLEDGYTGDTYCLDCGEKIEEGTSVPKLIAVFEDSSLSQKTEDETITSVKGRTIEELLAQASPTSYITNEYGFILEKDVLCYTGCILFLPDGTTLEIAVLGDIAADGLIMADDARMTLRKAVNLESLSAIQSLAADITGDGKIMADDARMILRAAVSLENTETWLK